jgi:hypothetical protein
MVRGWDRVRRSLSDLGFRRYVLARPRWPELGVLLVLLRRI